MRGRLSRYLGVQMTRSIAEWSRLAHELARAKGEHSVVCNYCSLFEPGLVYTCSKCSGNGTGRVDHKSPTRIASRLALIHLAISRAVDCVVNGGMALGWEGYAMDQPIGFPIALADVFLRLCDLAESLGVELRLEGFVTGPRFPCESPEETIAALNDLHTAVSRCAPFESVKGGTETRLQRLLDQLFGLATQTSVDLFAMAELKYAYEKGRAK